MTAALMIHPCRCGHEKADHQQRIGRHGNYTPCCHPECDCGGFRKASTSMTALVEEWRNRAQDERAMAVAANINAQRVAHAALAVMLDQCANELQAAMARRQW